MIMLVRSILIGIMSVSVLWGLTDTGYGASALTREISVPAPIGIVRERYIPGKPPRQVIILIQDLHAHYQAQRNISELLRHLTAEYALRLIALEGGSGKIDLNFYRELPDAQAKEQVADYFLQQARISGAEYFAITTREPIVLYGAESPRYYERNYQAFMDTLAGRDQALPVIRALENQLAMLTLRIYGPELRAFTQIDQAFANGALGVEDYVAALWEHRRAGDERKFPAIVEFLRRQAIRRTLAPALSHAEFNRLAQQVVDRLSARQRSEAIAVILRLHRSGEPPEHYYPQFKQWYAAAFPDGDFAAEWPRIAEHIALLQEVEEQNEFVLFDEIEQLRRRIKNNLAKTPAERRLVHYLRVVDVARQVVMTKLLPQDLAWMRRYYREFRLDGVRQFIKTQSRRHNVRLGPLPSLTPLHEVLPATRAYYAAAARRNDILAGRTLAAMRAEQQNSGILISGGFHSVGIAEYCRRRGIAYVMIVPWVDNSYVDPQRYLNALRGHKTPFEETIVPP